MHRWAAFRQLLLARLREFYREPEVLFWVYGFPLFLAAGLGLSFSGGSPDAPALSLTNLSVDVQSEPDAAEAAALAKRLKENGIAAQVHDYDACLHRLVTGRTSLFVVPEPR